MTVKRIWRAGVVTALMMAAGLGSAQAYVWASSSSPKLVTYNSATRGGGYGRVDVTASNRATLKSTLKDHRVDSMRTYATTGGSLGTKDAVRAESGRRSDGGTSYVRMKDKHMYSMYGTYIRQYHYWSTKVCMDRSWAKDPCSSPNAVVYSL